MADVWNDHDLSRIASDSFGLGLAKPGSGEYDFWVSGNYVATSNTVPVLSPTLMWNNERLILEVAFEQDPLKMEGTADFFSQDLSFNYGALNNVATFYGYDFAREIVIDDTTCNSWMSFQHLN
jgi:hypothetical protein